MNSESSIYNSQPDLTYIILTLLVICSANYVEDFWSRKKRRIIVQRQRELYFDTLKMEEEKINQNLSETVEAFQQENRRLESEMEALDNDGSDNWSTNDDYDDEENELPSGNEKDSFDKDDIKSNIELDQLKEELKRLHDKANQLKKAEEEICALTEQLGQITTNKEKLNEHIHQIEAENEYLKSQLKSSTSLSIEKNELDPLLNFLETHSELSLEVLEKIYNFLLEQRASNPELDIIAYIEELKRDKSTYFKELNNLSVAQKKAELKYLSIKKKYEEELTSFQEIRIEHILKNSGAAEYIGKVKEKNKINSDIINNLKAEIDNKKNELAKWQKKCHEAERDRDEYKTASRQAQNELVALKAEKKAKQARQAINLSSASSLLNDNLVPPPPPVDVPSVDEMLRAANIHQPIAIDSTIPPPPPVDMNEILRQAKSYH